MSPVHAVSAFPAVRLEALVCPRANVSPQSKKKKFQVSLVKNKSLPSHASHEIWRETCRGSPPFIRFWLQRKKKGKKETADLAASEEREERVAAFLNGLRLVQMGGGATCAPYIQRIYTSMTKA